MALVLALFAGLAAGVVNALAFSGSFLTLPALLWLGLGAPLANGTNRVGILVAAVVASVTFRRGGRLPLRGLLPLALASVAGSLLGAEAAARMPAVHLERIFGALMIAFLLLLLVEPRRFLECAPRARAPRTTAPVLLAFFAIGLYGGFAQAGVGILLLLGLVLGCGFDLVSANGVKNLLVVLFTLPALVVFAAHGEVSWRLGALLAAGQSAGAYLASRFAVAHPSAPRWIRRLLVVVLALTAMRLLFGLRAPPLR